MPPTEESENLWDKILNEASRSVADRLESKNVLILGDRNSGKSFLLARLEGMDLSEVSKGIALDYSFLDIHSSKEADDVSRMNVWQLEGESGHQDLLEFALNAQTIENSLVMITLDFSQPWYLLESLRKWLKVVEDHITSLWKTLPPASVKAMKLSLHHDYQQYAENSTSSHPPNSRISRKKRTIDEQTLLPLPEGVLSSNLGVPILVVVCKADMAEELEREYGYKEGHFEYIQQALRRECLPYGGGLMYTSALKGHDCDTLRKYLEALLYGGEGVPALNTGERDRVIVPIGSDSLVKIQVAFDAQTLTRDVSDPYEQIIKTPKRHLTSPVPPSLLQAEPDHVFLERHRGEGEEKGGKGGLDLLSSLKSIGADSLNKTSSPSPELKDKSFGTLPTTPSSPVASSGSVGASPDREHQVLADFFNSLIHKDRSAPRKGSADLKGLAIPPRQGSSSAPRDPKDLTIPPRIPGSPTVPRDDVAKQLDRLKNKFPKD